MFNWKLRYIFIKLNNNHSNCLALRPTKYVISEENILPLALLKVAGPW